MREREEGRSVAITRQAPTHPQQPHPTQHVKEKRQRRNREKEHIKEQQVSGVRLGWAIQVSFTLGEKKDRRVFCCVFNDSAAQGRPRRSLTEQRGAIMH